MFSEEKEEYPIPNKSLHRWYLDANLKLAETRNFRLNRKEFLQLVDSITDERQHPSFTELIEFGTENYFINPSNNGSEYSFPLAYILSFMSKSHIRDSVQFLINVYENTPVRNTKYRFSLEDHELFKKLSERESYILIRRLGLLEHEPLTLREIGEDVHISYERVRQIENKCWHKLFRPSYSKLLLGPFLLYILQEKGSLIVTSNEPQREIQFVAKCLNVPMSRYHHTDLYIIGLVNEGKDLPKDLFIDQITTEEQEDAFRRNCAIPLSSNDIARIAQIVNTHLPGQKPIVRTTKLEKTYRALKHIGHPAHYSLIASVYREMFTDDVSSEHNIHAILGRDRHRIVWIGIKGTYALKEWGFEHPSLTLFDTIAMIVEQKYQETNSPVSLTVISAEMGKYRRSINCNSIAMASYFNKRLKEVGKGYFIPAIYDEANTIDNNIKSEELDKILQRFEITVKGGGNRTMTTQIESILAKEKETPGTWRFKENKEDHPMTIYLTKEQVNELGSPESIKVTITAT